MTTGAGIVASLGQLLGLAGGGGSGKADAAGDVETGDNEAEKQAQAGRHLLRGLSRSNSGSFPMCLICLEPFTEEDFNVITPLPPFLRFLYTVMAPAFTSPYHRHAVRYQAPFYVRCTAVHTRCQHETGIAARIFGRPGGPDTKSI